MTDGFGAGFAAISLLATLGVLALLATFGAAVRAGVDRRSAAVSRALRNALGALGLVALVVSGFAVLALVDEAPALAALFAGTVLVPLLVVVVMLRRTRAIGHLKTGATTAAAWGPAFIVGVIVALGLQIGGVELFGLTQGESRNLGLPYVASAVGGLVVLAGTWALSVRGAGRRA